MFLKKSSTSYSCKVYLPTDKDFAIIFLFQNQSAFGSFWWGPLVIAPGWSFGI